MSLFKILTGGALASSFLFGLTITVQAAPINAEEIRGQVQDDLGRPIATASLQLKTAAGNDLGSTQSDADGRFTFAGITQGIYKIQAEKPGFQLGSSNITVSAGSRTTTTITLAAQEALELPAIQVVAERLDKARNGLSPKTGGSVYRFNANDVAAMPEGSNTSFNQVLLQAPGVANDSFGQLHVRGDHGNLQYRINGIILPEGITGFGQALDTRFAKRIDLLTGALPAQYGYRTAGVIEIDTKSQLEEGGRIDLYGGRHGTVNPSFEYGNTRGDLTYYVTGSYLTDNLGIENPTSSSSAIHDKTNQEKGFAYLSYLVNPTTRVSAMLGSYDGKFQIPNNPGQAPDPNFLAHTGVSNFDSAALNERQHETNRYSIVALQSTLGADFDYQVALFARYTSVHFVPDPIGDLVFNGVASNVFRSSFSTGIQGDGSYWLNDDHTLRMGLMASTENVRSDNSTTVFPVDALGNVSGSPFTLVDNNRKNDNRLLGLYLQDEWRANDKLTLNYGARFDQINAFVSESQLSPRFGLVFKATPQTTLHAGYARYFTPPPSELVSPETIALFANTSNAPEVNLNSPVKSERSHYFDVGATHQLTSAFSLGIDGFYKHVSNLIDEGQFGQALIFSPFNYAQGKIYGVELTSNYKSDNLNAYANLARTTSLAKDITSAQFNFGQQELDYIASHWVHTDHDQTYTASAGASYTWSEVRWSADSIYGSGLRRGFANTDHLPSYVQVNLGATKKFKTADFGPFEAHLAVINAFDRVYEIRDGSGIGVGAPQYGPRRGIFIGLSKSF
jgi:outer membrane receptor protein involved in Fe transport